MRYARPLLAGDEEAEALFQTALEANLIRAPALADSHPAGTSANGNRWLRPNAYTDTMIEQLRRHPA